MWPSWACVYNRNHISNPREFHVSFIIKMEQPFKPAPISESQRILRKILAASVIPINSVTCQTGFEPAERKKGAFCRLLCLEIVWGTDCEALELATSIVNYCVLSILIATLLQHLTHLNKKSPPNFEGGSLAFRQHALMLGIYALFSSKIAVFLRA